MVTLGALVFTFLNTFLVSSAGKSSSCDLINHFIRPSPRLKAGPQSGLCSTKAQINCCTDEVEAKLTQDLKATSHIRVFNSILQFRQIAYPKYKEFEHMKIQFLNEDLQTSALQFSILDGINTNRQTLIEHATNSYLNTFVDIETIPEYCKSLINPKLRIHLYRYFEELVYAKHFISKNWNIANQIFNMILSTELSSNCLEGLLRTGIADVSCKMCRDDTVNVPTCFNLCEDAVSDCMEPFKDIIPVFDNWLRVYLKVQQKVSPHISKERFDKIYSELQQIILENEIREPLFADVCKFHFQKIRIGDDENNSNNIGRRRQKRVEKLRPLSTRMMSFPTTATPAVASTTEFSNVAGNNFMDPFITCSKLMPSFSHDYCWNGTNIGTYVPAPRSASPEKFPDFKERIALLDPQLNELSELLERNITRVSPTESNELENPAQSLSNQIKHSILFLFLNIIFTLKILC